MLLREHGARGTHEARQQGAPAATRRRWRRPAVTGSISISVDGPRGISRLALPQVSAVREEAEQEEDGGADVGPSHHAGHRLRVHWVDDKQQRGEPGGRGGGAEQLGGQLTEQAAHDTVQQHIDQVVAPGPQPAGQVVESEAEHGDGSVRLVRSAVTERGAPEVVPQ